MITKSRTESALTPPTIAEIAEAQAYKNLVERLAADRVSRRIPNGRALHASILLETMLRNAQAVVRIFTGELAASTYDRWELTDAARAFLGRPGSRLRILLQHSKDKNWLEAQPLVQAIRTIPGGPKGILEVRCATGVYSTDRAKHFSVMDEAGYRYEHDHSAAKAIANFNEPDTAGRLAVTFDRAFSLSAAVLA